MLRKGIQQIQYFILKAFLPEVLSPNKIKINNKISSNVAFPKEAYAPPISIMVTMQDKLHLVAMETGNKKHISQQFQAATKFSLSVPI